MSDIIRSVQNPVKQQFRRIGSGAPAFTLVHLDSDYDQDTGINTFSARFSSCDGCGRPVDRNDLTEAEFRNLVGKLGRKFDNQLREVA
jgi:hypothetical protein